MRKKNINLTTFILPSFKSIYHHYNEPHKNVLILHTILFDLFQNIKYKSYVKLFNYIFIEFLLFYVRFRIKYIYLTVHTKDLLYKYEFIFKDSKHESEEITPSHYKLVTITLPSGFYNDYHI